MAEQDRKKNTKFSGKSKTGIQKTATQIEGLDEILQGGFPTGRTTLVGGGPGTGKSVLGLEFIYRGAMSGHPGIFLTFEETAESFDRRMDRSPCFSFRRFQPERASGYH
ncbi:MAG: ATPase domain-containing protein [Desulfobacterales bacterium]